MSDLPGDLSEWEETEEPDTYDGAALTVPYDKIPPIPATDLWPGVVPNRTPVYFIAPGGTGKGLVIAKITAMVTTGESFPGQRQPRQPGTVITIAPEDEPKQDMAFRLRAAGADLALVRDLTVLPDGSPFLLPGNIRELQQAIAEINAEGGPPVQLITLDPLLALCENGLNTVKAARAVTGPLQDMTKEYGGAMILSHHTTKSRDTVAGSKSLTDAARLVWMISRAPDDPDVREMNVWKTNRKTADGIRYRIEGDGENVHAVFTRADTAVAGSRAARLRLAETSPAELARQWLASHPKQPEEAGSKEKAA